MQVPAILELPGKLYIVHEDAALIDGWCVRHDALFYNKELVGRFVGVASQDIDYVWVEGEVAPADHVVNSTTVNVILQFG